MANEPLGTAATDERREAAVGPGNHPLTAHRFCVADKPLGDELGMLDEVVGGFNDAGNQDLVLGNYRMLPCLPFMSVARVGRLKGQSLGLRFEQARHEILNRRVVVVRPVVIAETQMQPQTIRRQIAQCVIQRLHMQVAMAAVWKVGEIRPSPIR